MRNHSERISILSIALFAWMSMFAHTASAEATTIGAKQCKSCHENEYVVWSKTQHFKSYRSAHKNKKAAKILAAAGGNKSMKKNQTCLQCHYTRSRRNAKSAWRARSGPSCESCHGPASEWMDPHKDFGGPTVKAENETPAHRAKRIAKSTAAGLIWGHQAYSIASNCMECHGLTRTTVDAATLGKMMDAGHPFEPDYELVRYSQGQIRHRFYPPDINSNKAMTKAELAHFFVVGQAAKLVSATRALKSKGVAGDYKKAQEQRAAEARKALSAVSSEPTVAALLSSPTDANGRKVDEALRKKDVSGKVGSMLPGKYK